MSLQLNQVSAQYPGPQPACLRRVSLSLAAGEIGVLMGPSGCGKTTLLRCIAGLHPVQQGTVSVDPRGVGMVFQDYALFPHLSVAGNIEFGLNRWPAHSRHSRVQALLEMVALQDLAHRYPHELSGGQQQRVALARAMAPQPQVLLLDEPFSSLDVALRQQLAQTLKQWLKQEQMTALIVTHDQQEAFALGDRIGVMLDGVLHQWASPQQLYRFPETREVAQFMGLGAWLKVEPVGDASVTGWESALGHWDATRHGVFGQRAWLRAEDVVLQQPSSRRAQVAALQYRGADNLCQLQLTTGEYIWAMAPIELTLTPGDWVGVSIRAPGTTRTLSASRLATAPMDPTNRL